jgi:acyl carrier protein
MFDKLNVLYIDHVAVTTINFEETAQHYLSLPNARILRGPGWNASQKVNYLFISFGADLSVEILGLPENKDSPIASHVGSGGGAYHLCYAVNDLDYAVSQAKDLGSKVLSDAKADDAFDGRRVSFLYHPSHGIFELLEAYGSLQKNPKVKLVNTGINISKPGTTDQKDQSVRDAIENAFINVFGAALSLPTNEWTTDNIEKWNSLQHLRLIMEIERSLDVSIPSQALGNLTSFDKLLQETQSVLREKS